MEAGRDLGASKVLHTGMRAAPVLALAVLGLLFAAPADARLAYVARAATATPLVYTADDDGKGKRLLGAGKTPAVSPDGRWVAYVSVPRNSRDLEELILVPIEGGARRLLTRARSITDVRFSPSSGQVAAIVRERRVRLYDIGQDATIDTARGHIRGYSFSPDGAQLAFGVATGPNVGAPTDIYIAPLDRSVERRRLTTTGDALNPVWGPTEIIYDRQRRRRGNPPAYNLWATDPAGATAPRQLTSLRIPPLVSGLVPLEISADGRRLLAVFVGQDIAAGFTMNLVTGRSRAMSRDFEAGLVGFDMSADGRSILAHTGGPDPNESHDVVQVPFRGGKPVVLVENAGFPDWSH
jgi:dipeptidyl aminopeptidase/acylaminoacyl peptidase